MADLLKINYNAEDYVFHKQSLDSYLQSLLQNDILKGRDPTAHSLEGMLDHTVLTSNARRLEIYYQKRLSADDIDERFYIKEHKANTPGKFTPFAKQGATNKLVQQATQNQQPLSEQTSAMPQAPKKAFHSHRVLNYDVTENVTARSNLSEIKFANKAIPQSPYTRLMPATPMTAALEMYNWLSEKVRNTKKVYSLTVLDLYCTGRHMTSTLLCWIRALANALRLARRSWQPRWIQ